MQGYPKWLNSKVDVLNVVRDFPRKDWEKDLQALIDNRFGWYPVKNLDPGENGIEDDTHKVVDQGDGAEMIRTQYELRENPNARIYQMGLTVEEVQSMLDAS